MINEIKNIVESSLNQTTGKTLGEEGRIVSVEAKAESGYLITYNRDGISPQEKRTVEASMLDLLKDAVNTDELSFKTVSKEMFTDIKADTPDKEKVKKAAQLNAGHGAMVEKRRIPGAKKVIAVSSGKGGVGKSTISVNLAISLKNMGYKVGLLDNDIYGPSMPMMLNQRATRPIATEDNKISPVEAYGIKFMSFGLFIGETDPVIWRGPMLNGIVTQFLFDVVWGDLDYLILDLPPGTGDVQLSLIQNTFIDGSLIVSTPQEIALLDTKKGLKMFEKVDVPVLGMVENMSSFICDSCDKEHFIFGNGGVKKAAKELDVNYLAGIPLDISIGEGSDEGIPFMENYANEGKAVWNSYMELSKRVIELS